VSRRWSAVVGILGLAGLAVAALTSVDDIRAQALPNIGALGLALVLQFVALAFAAQAWIALFPPDADRTALARGIYTSQLTKYLPAGGLFQAASQVAMSSQNGVAAAALRLPIFSLAAVVASATVGAGLAFDSDLPGLARLLAGLGLLAVVALDRRVIQAILRLARRVSHRIPDPSTVPPQRAILRCYLAHLVNMAAVSAAFAVLLGDLTDVDLWAAGAGFALAWAIGYLILPLPSGLGVREAVLVATLPGLATGSLLAASVAQRVLTLISEGVLTGVSHGRVAMSRRRAGASGEPGEPGGPDVREVPKRPQVVDSAPT